MLDSTKRLSIDIDIILPVKENDLEAKLGSFVENKNFTRFELHERKASSTIEKAHYKFLYKPSYHSG